MATANRRASRPLLQALWVVAAAAAVLIAVLAEPNPVMAANASTTPEATPIPNLIMVPPWASTANATSLRALAPGSRPHPLHA